MSYFLKINLKNNIEEQVLLGLLAQKNYFCHEKSISGVGAFVCSQIAVARDQIQKKKLKFPAHLLLQCTQQKETKMQICINIHLFAG